MPSKSKDAHRLYQSDFYKKNKDYYKNKRAKRREALISKLESFKSCLSCALCPESDPVTLDFHHFDPEQKDSLIFRLANNGVSWNRIVTEIEKCVCLCANCHRKVHKYKTWARKVRKNMCIVVSAYGFE